MSAEAASLRLHRNERVTTFRPAEHDAMTASISVDDLVRYPDQSATASAVAALFGVAEAQLSLYAGSESSVRAVFDVMVDPGDPVLCLRPAYRGYSREAFSHRADLRRVGYDNAMRLDVPALLDEVARGPRLVILGSPDALGQPLPRDVVPAVLAGLERGGALLVVDEAYHGFGAPTVVDLVSAHPQLVVLRTFSKAWGLAGVRCGVAIAHASTARLLNRVRLRNEVSGPTLAIVRYVLRHPELRDEYVRAVVSARDILSEIFAGLGFDVVGSMANFLVMRVPQPHTAETVCARALAAGIAIAAPLPDAVRVTIGPLERMQPLVEHVRSEYTSGGRGAA